MNHNKNILCKVLVLTIALMLIVPWVAKAETEEVTLSAAIDKESQVDISKIQISEKEMERILKVRAWQAAHSLPKRQLPVPSGAPFPQNTEELNAWLKQHPDYFADMSDDMDLSTNAVNQQIELPVDGILNGDIIFGHRGWPKWGYYRHVAMYVSNNEMFISAYPGDGVRYEGIDFWQQGFDELNLCSVWTCDDETKGVITAMAATHLGEPYDYLSSKDDATKWYCSKLVWFEYDQWADQDLDADWGYFVFPVDLYNSWRLDSYWEG